MSHGFGSGGLLSDDRLPLGFIDNGNHAGASPLKDSHGGVPFSVHDSGFGAWPDDEPASEIFGMVLCF